MLPITIKTSEQWDEINGFFIPGKEQALRLEHSLIALSKWESKWCKHFINNKNLTNEELVDYIKCMNTTPNVPDDIFDYLSYENIKEINDYIAAPMTATTFSKTQNGGGGRCRDIITSEVLYAQMVELNIPFECEKWHLNRLMTLIRVCSVRSQPAKKMSKGDIMSRNRALNAARRQQLNTRG